MKNKKLLWISAFGLMGIASALNYYVAFQHESRCKDLMKENVQAKAGLIDWFIAYLFTESKTNSNNVKFEMIDSEGTCPSITISSGTLEKGSAKANNFLSSLNAGANVSKGVFKGNLDTNLSYQASVDGTDSQSLKYEYSLVFLGNKWKRSTCRQTSPNNPEGLNPCIDYDECSKIVSMRGDAYWRAAVGLR